MFRNMVTRLQDYFGISRKEARGALVLMLLCLFLIWTPFVFRRWILPIVPVNENDVDLKKLDSIAVRLEKENQLKFKKYKKYPQKNDDIKSARSFRLFDFDPNTATVDELTELGIPVFLAKRMEKFRSKGGKFRKKEDLLTIYDFPSSLYERLEKHIVLPFAASTIRDKIAEKDKAATEKKILAGKPVISEFDINKADTAQLVRLRGIGSKLSMRILKFRDGLGGFHSASQYAEIFGLDSLALSELNRFAKVQSAVKKIDINTATAEELNSHTYLKNRKIAAILINYRDQHGAFRSADDLRKVKVVDEIMIRKIEPYLSF
ncbi:ComEA family DNA-binding protein [Dyadobacter sediminis]|uniref:Helix-hairpin-helix domain-containing protein n=1 Tax=Dyadobacter sediminis TaxID=1493691 RepID=A0A5R9KAG2_9BACT|nr:helix-hairpin-helix domain-containing protein [Dyadobacter sediminis]TLU91714.1 helix-hairpin-helix domain-containing protein [Dyadobacter sediminis]GGC00944.1 competence protein ComEA [Dyadobacter sediminis]